LLSQEFIRISSQEVAWGWGLTVLLLLVKVIVGFFFFFSPFSPPRQPLLCARLDNSNTRHCREHY